METPPRGKTAPLLSALSRFSVCGPENGQSPFSVLLRRKILPRELCEAKFSPPICSTSERMSNTDIPLRAAKCFCRTHFLPMQRGKIKRSGSLRSFLFKKYYPSTLCAFSRNSFAVRYRYTSLQMLTTINAIIAAISTNRPSIAITIIRTRLAIIAP